MNSRLKKKYFNVMLKNNLTHSINSKMCITVKVFSSAVVAQILNERSRSNFDVKARDKLLLV